ncbi:MAG: hypothetical protein ACC667_07795 [Longimicrobiales bacterium]
MRDVVRYGEGTGRSTISARIVAVTFSMAVALTACASPGAGPFDDGVEPGTIHVEVDNHNFYDATVYVITGAGERRLGIVRGKSEKTYVARLLAPGEVRLRVRMLAGGSFTTDPMNTIPGETIQLIIPAGVGDQE